MPSPPAENAKSEAEQIVDKINEVWHRHYGGGPVTDIKALMTRLRCLDDDLDCWKFNARVCNKEYVRLEALLKEKEKKCQEPDDPSPTS